MSTTTTRGTVTPQQIAEARQAGWRDGLSTHPSTKAPFMNPALAEAWERGQRLAIKHGERVFWETGRG